jgi:hypothetical protein
VVVHPMAFDCRLWKIERICAIAIFRSTIGSIGVIVERLYNHREPWYVAVDRGLDGSDQLKAVTDQRVCRVGGGNELPRSGINRQPGTEAGMVMAHPTHLRPRVRQPNF